MRAVLGTVSDLKGKSGWCAVAVAGVLTLLLGCSPFGENGYFRDRTMDYKAAKPAPQYEVGNVPDAVHQRISPVLPIPEIAQRKDHFTPQDFNDVPRPQVVELVEGEGRVQLLRGADTRWLWLEADSASAFVWFSHYFNDAGFTVSSGSRVGQVLKTDWHDGYMQTENKSGFWSRSVASIKKRTAAEKPFERYRVLFSSTSTGGLSGTRVLVERQVVMAESIDSVSEVSWDSSLSAIGPETQNDTQSEVKSKDGLLQRYPEREWWQPLVRYMDEQVTASMAASSASADASELTAKMRKDGNGLPVLTIDQPFARSWDAVGVALNRIKHKTKVDLSIEDLDRSLAVYFLKWRSPGDREPMAYQLHLVRGEIGVLISVQVDDNTIAPPDKSEILLALIEKQLAEIGG